ncbi:MAG: hypothetical protein QM817_30525 [Archangium sp.]
MRRQLGFLPATLAALAALSGCKPPDAALKVTVTLKSQGTTKVRADCIKLAVLQDAVEKKYKIVKRPADDTLVFGVLRGEDLPASVNLQVTGYLGKCDDESTLQLNAQGGLEPATFPESGVLPFELSLDPPGVALDGDRDGFVSAVKGGPDCRDDDATIFPGATQVCSSQVDTDCDSNLGCDDSECGSATFCLDQAERVVVSPMAPTMNRGDCLPVRIELANASGPRTAVRDTPVTFTSSITGVTVHNTSNCGDMALTSLPILFNTTFIDVFLKADETAFGSNTFTATASRVPTPGTAVVEVHPRPVTGIRFTNQPLTLNAGTCGATPISLEFFDMGNLPTAVDAPTTINLSATPGEVVPADEMIYGDANCMTPAPTVMLQPGQGTATVYLSVKRAGPHTIRAAPSIGTAAMQNFNVMPGTPHHLKFTNGTLALLTTSFCSTAQLVVELQDSFNNPSPLNMSLPLTMSVMGAAPVRFFQTSDTGCTVPLTDFTLPAGATAINIQAGSMGTGTGTRITAAANITVPPILPDTQDIIISSGPASTFAWTGQPQTTLAGVCSASPITIELRDTTMNLASSPTALNFNLFTTPGADSSFHFYTGAGCLTDLNGVVTVPSGQTSTQIYFRGNRAVSNFTISASSTLNPPPTMFTGNSILPNIPAKLSFGVPNTQTAQAGSCTAAQYVVNVLDTFDNPTVFTTAQTVTVGSNPAGVTVGTAPACTGSSLPLPTMTGSASFSARHTVTSPVTPYQLTATVAGFSTSTPATLTVTPGMPSLIVDVPAGGSTSVTAGACQNVTLSRRDMFNNNAPTSGNNNVSITFPNGTQWDLYAQQNCMGAAGGPVTMNNTHTTSFSIRPKTAGMHMVQAAVATTNAVINFTVAPGTPTLVFETPNTLLGTASAAQTAGGCTPVTIARKDSFGNDVPLGSAQNVTFTLPSGTTIHPDSGCSMAAITTIPLTANDVRATFYVKATASAPTGGPAPQNVSAILSGQTATLTLTVSPASPNLAFVAPTGGMASVAANTCVTVTIERRDSFGNLVPIPGGTTTMALVASGSIVAFDSNNCTGTAQTTSLPVTPGNSSKTFSVRSTIAATPSFGLTLAGQMLTLGLTVSPGPLAVLLVENVPSMYTAGTCTAQSIVVHRKDNFTNDIVADPPLSVTFSSPRFSFSSTPTTCAGAMATANVVIPNGSAVSTDPVFARATLATAPATTTIVATSMSPMLTGTATTTVNAAAPIEIFFSNAAGSVTSGSCSASLTVQLRDAFMNTVLPSSPYTITTSSSATATFFARTACGLPSGTTFNLTSASPTGTFTFNPATATMHTITASGTGPTLSANQSWNVTAGAVAKLNWQQPPTAAPARFGCVSAGIIQTLDAANNVALTAADTVVTPTATAGAGLTFYSDAACTSVISNFTISSGFSASNEFFMLATGGGSSTVSATSGVLTAAPNQTVTPTGAAGSFVVTGTADLEAGACQQYTIQRRDGANAVLNNGTTIVTPSVATGGTLSTSSDCTAAAPATLTIPHGMNSTTVYVRGRSATPTGATTAATANLTASDATAGSTNGVLSLTVYPLVRRGSCDLVSVATLPCSIGVPIPNDDISRTFLIITSTGRPSQAGNTLDASDQNVECHLDNSSGVNVVCNRQTANGTMNIKWQTVSYGRDYASGFGATVQHFRVNLTGSTAMQTVSSAPLANSFILMSNTYESAQNDGNGFPIIKLNSPTQVQLDANGTATNRFVSFQVVSLAGSTVVHANSAPTSGMGNPSYGMTLSASTNAFLLMTAQITTTTEPNVMCKRITRARFNSGNGTFRRGGVTTPPTVCTSDAIATMNVSKVTLPVSGSGVLGTATQLSDITITSGNPNGNTMAFTAVPLHRSITLLGQQGPGGQSGGESDFNNMMNDGDDTSHFHAVLDFNGAGTMVNAARTLPASGTPTSVFTPFLVTFDP